MRRPASAAIFLALWASAAAAQELRVPAGAEITRSETEEGSAYRLPTGPWAEDGLPAERIDGTVTRTAWKVPRRDLTPQQLIAPMRAALAEAGWEVVLDCETEGCGGFDFRFATEVIPAPEMYVDLTNYRFLAARGPDGAAGLGILASRDGSAGYIQAIRVSPVGQPETDAPAAPVASTSGRADDLISTLETRGHVVLSDLRFESGAASLGEGSVASLDRIATYLSQAPDRSILLVGHTDATGSLDANRAVSRQRAQAAADYLRDRGVAASRIAAEGAGYLAPAASNLTDEGRLQNRRVEAVLLPAG
ncbi:cell envelope biogenesis protein OmpA [Roseivivax halodurans JCM 10272]|uniref:Cell envelope biogenesis protein OmpA n=1 Tax=Roseivivax halodurans JCM 10272 TaxID=1449350 RepID=X7EFC7_9RHOB|nr:OmpA family protein [Roseivivax halodurans]ETX13818.1 cell envelope biogenesis protein OmpA [Roseivivax halodurans JCM 10272]